MDDDLPMYCPCDFGCTHDCESCGQPFDKHTDQCPDGDVFCPCWTECSHDLKPWTLDDWNAHYGVRESDFH